VMTTLHVVTPLMLGQGAEFRRPTGNCANAQDRTGDQIVLNVH
jgi:hypothetical protein